MKQYDLEAQARSIIAEELKAFRKGGGTIKALAEKSNLHPTTVSKLIYKETRFPKFSTVYGLLKATGYEFEIKQTAPSLAEQSEKIVELARQKNKNTKYRPHKGFGGRK